MAIDIPVYDPKARTAKQKWEMTSRLDAKEDARKLDDKQLERWKKEVRARDKGKDRYTGKRVVITLELRKDRAECHHVTGRQHKPTRYDRRNGLLVSLETHEAIERGDLQVVGTKDFTIGNRSYIDCDFPVTFKRMTV